jgi:hypothetical protein
LLSTTKELATPRYLGKKGWGCVGIWHALVSTELLLVHWSSSVCSAGLEAFLERGAQGLMKYMYRVVLAMPMPDTSQLV